MSQSPVKKEVGVKSEPQDKPLISPESTGTPNGSGVGTPRRPVSAASTPTSVTSNTSNANTPSTSVSDSGWQEIPLKSCTKEEINDIRFHIMKFQNARDINIVEDFTKPVRMHRKDPRNIQFQLTREEIDRRKREQAEEKIKQEQLEEQLDEESRIAQQEAIEKGEDPRKYRRIPEIAQVAPDGGARKAKKNLFKKKTRQINLMDDEKRKLRYEEYYPWVIEDYDGKNVFVGNYEAGSSDTQHVLFVFDKDGFKMVPAEKVYKFTPRNKYATLTLEEAEAKMEKNSSVPRWLMKHMEDKSTTENTQDQRFRNTGQQNGASNSQNQRSGGSSFGGRKGLRTVLGGGGNDRDSDHDDLDFDEEFADDEEAPIMDGDEEENKLSEQKIKKEMLKAAHFDGQSDAEIDDDLDDLFETEKSRKVDKEGKKLRKVLNKTEGGVYDSEDDDKLNPYLSKSDLESNDDDSDEENPVKEEPQDGIPKDATAKKTTRSIFAHNSGDGFVVIKAPSEFLYTFPKGDWIPNGRKRPSPSASPPRKKIKVDGGSPTKIHIKTEDDGNRRLSPSPVPVSPTIDLNSSGPDNVLVTIREVLDMVKNNPLTTKELLLSLKTRVNAHKDNKQRIISIVKQNLKLIDGKLELKE